MRPIAHQQYGRETAGTEQPGGLARILAGAARSSLDQQGCAWHTATQRCVAHDLGLGNRPGASPRKHQQRRGFFPKQLDAALEAPFQRRRGAAAENDNRIGRPRPVAAHLGSVG
jgi:hypothetical protein